MSQEHTGSSELARLVWPRVPDAVTVLVPIGSTEQHGPHLPFTTDSVIARAVAARAADHPSLARPHPPLVAPTITYGSSGEHAGFPGTVSIGREALLAVVVETVRSLSLWAGRIVFVNGHGGNVPTLDQAVGRLRAEGHDVAWTLCAPPGSDAHAGRAETSVMLHLVPDEVRVEAATAGDTRPLAEIMPELIAHGVRAVSPNGVLGDPTGASAEEGAALLDAMVASAVRRIARFRVDARGRLTEETPTAAGTPTAEGTPEE
ncbi:mycofactocin biosynthesis peptidyl-dipeptidase MftE [Streptomyces sp. AcH 505]|uniref:mycofactocin biosynthesis peptidyl-dipeptidase MftE n=1 Tax=Streptomyces sp. AcH 505 TaxID=352211 RepID=UPI000A619922